MGFWLGCTECLGCCEKKKKKSFGDGAMAAHLMVVNTKLKWWLVDCWCVGWVCMYVRRNGGGGFCMRGRESGGASKR